MAAGRYVFAVIGLIALPFPLGPADVGATTGTAELGADDAAVSIDYTLDSLADRMRAVESEANGLELLLSLEVTSLAQVLTERGADPELAAQIARALVREGRSTGIAPQMLLAVLLVENPWIDPERTSRVGAVGLMQVMPFHQGNWGCGSGKLTDPDVNVCSGARILALAIARTAGDMDLALLRYNGCVRGRNTPDCHLYPSWVRRARASVSLEPSTLLD